jgi:hypothetical protein
VSDYVIWHAFNMKCGLTILFSQLFPVTIWVSGAGDGTDSIGVHFFRSGFGFGF